MAHPAAKRTLPSTRRKDLHLQHSVETAKCIMAHLPKTIGNLGTTHCTFFDRLEIGAARHACMRVACRCAPNFSDRGSRCRNWPIDLRQWCAAAQIISKDESQSNHPYMCLACLLLCLVADGPVHHSNQRRSWQWWFVQRRLGLRCEFGLHPH